MDYCRLKLVDHAKNSFTLTLETISENEKWLHGWEVRRDGERKERQHLIDKTTIVKRVPLKMNLHYGELELIR